MRTALRVHTPTLAWAALLALLLLLPAEVYIPPEGSWLDLFLSSVPLLDKLIHASVFAVMAWLAWRSFDALGLSSRVLPAAASASIYGVSLELLQTLIPGRAAGGPDMIANTVGAVCGAIMAAWMGGSLTGRGRIRLSGRDSAADDPVVEELES